MRMLDQARRALSGGDPAAGIRALDAHRRQFPRGAFTQEAVLLRIQALAQSGNHSAARALAQRFRERHPNSPHLRRIESVLGGQ
jgi:outer membrane protein assembly factor BamD (BamD/ComL family)